MQAEYRKEQTDTYLWILAEIPGKYEDTENMLRYNPGEGRLEFSKREENGQEYYCYKVTGKKALHGIYAMMSIGERQIRNILGQIFDALERGKEYLLCEEDFVLQPQYMFATLPKMEIELCYIPGYGVPLKEQLENFFEYLLNRVDYDDKRAVQMLYDCYMFCVKEQGGWMEIRNLVQKAGMETENAPENMHRELREKEWETEEVFTEEKPVTEVSASYVSWLTDRFFHRKKKAALLVAEEREEYRAEKKKNVPLREEENEDMEEMMERTVLLSAAKTTEEPWLTNEKTGEVIRLSKFPFYIGSVEQYADYALKEEGISRIHCCIMQKGDNYYLSDLNSTNGTYLDRKEVVPGKEELLATGSRIRMAKTEFYVNLPCH